MQGRIQLDSFFAGTSTHTTLLGTRPGASAIATYAILEHLGEEGFLQITKRNFENTEYLCNRLKEEGFSLKVKPELNIVTFEVANAISLTNKMYSEGWVISVPKRCPDSMRIVVTHHITKDIIDQFIEALKKDVNT